MCTGGSCKDGKDCSKDGPDRTLPFFNPSFAHSKNITKCYFPEDIVFSEKEFTNLSQLKTANVSAVRLGA